MVAMRAAIVIGRNLVLVRMNRMRDIGYISQVYIYIYRGCCQLHVLLSDTPC